MAEAMLDTPGRVRAGLVAVLEEPGQFPPRDARAFRNLLLDHGGGDALPHVALLLRAYEWGVVERLPAACPDHTTWHVVGGAIARDFAAAQLVVSEAARWAVDSWALALGRVSSSTLAPPVDDGDDARESTPGPASAAPPPLRDAAAVRTSPGRGAASPVLATSRLGTTAPITRGTPMVTAPRRTAPSMPRATGPSRQDVVRTFAGTALVLLGVFAWTRVAATDEASSSGASSPASIAAPVPRGADGADTTAPPMAASATAPASPPPVAQPAPAAAATPMPATPPVAPPATPPTRAVATSPKVFPSLVEDVAGPPRDDDEVVLRDGRSYRGTIALVTAAEVFVQDEWSGLPFAFPVGVLREIRTRHGRVLRYDTTAVAALAGGAPGPRMTDYGIAGRYQVQTQGATIDGTEECRSTAARASLAATRREVIAHERGRARFTMDSRPGVEGALEPDGRFVVPVTEGQSGTTRWAFAMSGRFTPAGFTATSVLVTETPLAWRRVQRCRVRADLVALRER